MTSSVAPMEGRLDAESVPELLAAAWRTRRSGLLRISRGSHERRAALDCGILIGVEGDLAEDRFGDFLESRRMISGPDRARVEKLAADKACAQAKAVLALRLLEPAALYAAMRDAARGQLAETFEWRDGLYRWSALEEASATLRKGKDLDLLSLLLDELPKRWDAGRLFEAMMDESEHRAEIVPRSRRVVEKLCTSNPEARQMLLKMSGDVTIGRLLASAGGELGAAALLWVLLRAGLVREPVATEPLTAGVLDFEVEVAETTASAQPRRPESSRPAGGGEGHTRPAEESPAANALRREIEAVLGQIDAISHYEALGLDAAARPAEVKKAYFKAAKRYHPDALARNGLEDIKADAARVFARIAEAFEILSNEDKKTLYDAGGDNVDQIDTARLAQAETSYRKGEILLRMGNFAGALEYLEPAVELWPEEPAYQAALGWALFRQPRADAERAREHLEIAHQQSPEEAQILFRLGSVLRGLGARAEGDDCQARARSLDSSVSD